MDIVNLKHKINLKHKVNLNKENLKYKINKYIKKGKFDVKLDVSELTYNLLKHKYINNKMIGGANVTLNDKLLYHVALHGELLPKDYVKVPENLIVILPSCCGSSNYETLKNKFDIIKKISSGKNVYDTSKPVILNEKKHFIYIGGEEICNINLSYNNDNRMLTNGFIFDMENNKHSEKYSFGIIYFDENIMKGLPLRTDDFVSEYILKDFFQETSEKLLKQIEHVENIEHIEKNYDLVFSILYTNQITHIKKYVQTITSEMITFKENILINFNIDLFHFLHETFYKQFCTNTKLLLSIQLCVYALYFCMYDKDIKTIKSTLDNMTSLKLINKKIIIDFILPTYYFKNKEIIKTKIKNYDYHPDKFNLILSHIEDNILSMCTPPNKDKETLRPYLKDINILIVHITIYFYPFIVYYFHGYSDLTIDFVKMINNQDNKSITLKDVFSTFSELKSADQKIIVYINSCQGSVTDENMCYLYKCIKKHTKKINEIDINEKIFNIENPIELLKDIYEKTIFFNIYFKLFFKKYFTKDIQYNEQLLIKNNMDDFQEKIIYDKDFTEYLDNIVIYIQNKYDIDYSIGENEIDYGSLIRNYWMYIILFIYYMIQIMYNICKIILEDKTEDYLAKNSDKSDTFMYYTLKKNLTIDESDKDTFMYYAQKKDLTFDENYKIYFIKDIEHVYRMINNHIV
jgi:hypothetical protein